MYMHPFPITPVILAILRSLRSELDNIMLWAACCACLFVILQSSKITILSQKDYDSSVHLSHVDVIFDFDSRHTSSIAQINIKASKADPFWEGMTNCVGGTDNDLCPVAALATYMIIRDATIMAHSLCSKTEHHWHGINFLEWLKKFHNCWNWFQLLL